MAFFWQIIQRKTVKLGEVRSTHIFMLSNKSLDNMRLSHQLSEKAEPAPG